MRASAFRRAAAVLLLVSGLTLSLVAPADAGSRRLHDQKRDGPAAIDITKVRLINGPRMLNAVIHVRDLRRSGRLSLYVMQGPAVDEGYAANVRYRAASKNHAKARLVHWYVDHQRHDRCHVRASWSRKRDRVRVAFPHRCINWRYQRSYWMAARGSKRQDYDWTRDIRVRRG